MNKQIIKKSLTILATLVFCFAYTSLVQAATKPIRFTKDQKSIVMYTSQKKKINPKVSKKYKSSGIRFVSSNTKVVKVSKKGKLTALKKGKAKIYAYIDGASKKATCSVKVLQGIRSTKIKGKKKNYYIGKEYQLSYTATPKKSSEILNWKSSNENIATITENGLLKILAKGETTITLYSDYTEYSKDFKINTQEVPTINVKGGTSQRIKYGAKHQLQFEYINHQVEKWTYKSSDPTIATVSANGLVTALRPGYFYITATPSKKKERIKIQFTVENNSGFFENTLLYNNIDTNGCDKLMIVAHPDDETLWGGAHLMDKNWFVVCLTNHFTTVRMNEFKTMLKTAGIKGIILDYPDLIKSFDGPWVKNDWSSVRNGVKNDVKKLITSKNWTTIATHSPTGETGHIHHKTTNNIVTTVCRETNTFDKLWYFGTFYWAVPSWLPKITPEQLAFKQTLVNVYKNEAKPIDIYWKQMIPHENWVKATEYK